MPNKASDKPFRVGRSRTGLGLFATKPIKKGTLIVPYVGRMLDCTKPEDDAVENKYLFELTKRWTIDGSVRENVARYINHACRPNAEAEVKPIRREVLIWARRDIQPGEEINYDYGKPYFKEFIGTACKCAACTAKRAKSRQDPARKLSASQDNKRLS